MADATWDGALASAIMAAAGARGLNKAAEHLMASSIELSPYDSGDMTRGHSVVQATPTDLEAGVVVNTPDGYAVPQHEDLSFVHPRDHNPNAQAKFLETPMRRDRSTLLGITAAEIRRAM